MFSINSHSDISIDFDVYHHKVVCLMRLFSTDFASSYSMFQMLKGGYVLSIHSQQPIYSLSV